MRILKFYKDLSLSSELNGDFNWSNAKIFQPSYNTGLCLLTQPQNLTCITPIPFTGAGKSI
jgi:hypothetical protein